MRNSCAPSWPQALSSSRNYPLRGSRRRKIVFGPTASRGHGPAHANPRRSEFHARPSDHPRGLARARRSARHRRPRLHRRRLCRGDGSARPSPGSRRSTARSSPISPIAARADIDRAVRSARRGVRERGLAQRRSGQEKEGLCCASRSSSASMARSSPSSRRSTSASRSPMRLAVDVPFCANCIQYYAELADKLYRRNRAGRRERCGRWW